MQTPNSWHRRVWLLAVPIILSNVTVPLVGAVDTAVMGHLPGAENIAAVALGASIFSLVFWTFGFLRMGSGGLIAQHFGATDEAAIQLTLLRYEQYAKNQAEKFYERYMVTPVEVNPSGRKVIGKVEYDEGVFPTTTANDENIHWKLSA